MNYVHSASPMLILLILLTAVPRLGAQPGSEIVSEEILDDEDGTGADSGPLADLESEAEQRFAEDDLDGALLIYRQLAREHTDSAKRASALILVGWIEHQSDGDDAAMVALTEALTVYPSFQLRSELYTQGFVDLFLEAQKKATVTRDDRAIDLVRGGIDRLRARDYGRARQSFSEALEYQANHPQAIYNLALVDLYEGHHEKALGGFQKLAALAESRPDSIDEQLRGMTLTNVGYLYNRRQLYQEAETALEQAVRFYPQNTSAWSNLGISRRRLGKKVPAAEAFRKAHQLNPEDPVVLNNLALAYIDTADWVSAVALLKGATERFSDNASLWLNFGLAQQGLGNQPGAVASFEAAIRNDPGNTQGWAQAASAHLANYYLELEDYAQVRVLAERVLSWNNASSNGWSYKGLAQWRTGDLEGARQSLEEARRLEPTQAQTHNNLGSVYMEMRLLPQAEEAFRRALAIDGSLGEAQANLDNVLAMRAESVSGAAPGATRLPRSSTSQRPPLVSPPPPPPPPPPPRARLGLRFSDVDYSALGLKGVMVESVIPATLASRSGIQPKDLILKIDGQDVTSSAQLERYVRESKEQSVVLDLLRDNLPKRVEMSLQ